MVSVENVTRAELKDAVDTVCEKIGRDFEGLEDKLDTFMESSREEHNRLEKKVDQLLDR